MFGQNYTYYINVRQLSIYCNLKNLKDQNKGTQHPTKCPIGEVFLSYKTKFYLLKF